MYELFLMGGWVMYPILACSVASWAMIVERLFHFAGTALPDRRWNELKAGSLPKVTLAESRFAEVHQCHLDHAHEEPDQREARSRLAAGPHLKADGRGLALLSAVASLGPLLGLFGTVLGMIDLIRDLSAAGGRPDLEGLVGGIWTALLTTGFGLVAALPALVAHQWFDSVAARRADRLQEYHQRLELS